MYQFFRRNIPFSQLRHNDLTCYVNEGYGGQPIDQWPVYSFFCMYLSGDVTSAEKAFADWYLDQLKKYSGETNEKGGMYKGSLYSLIEKLSGKSFENTNEEERLLGIKERVKQRFLLLEDIKHNGYDTNTERIEGVSKNGVVYLKGGHHRAAALLALGREELPAVLVYPNQFVYNFKCLLRKLKQHASF